LEEDLSPLDCVITVCNKAAGEQYSERPGQPAAAHWDLLAPAAEGGETHRSWALLDVAVQPKRHIELLQALPLEPVNRVSLQRHAVQGPRKAHDRDMVMKPVRILYLSRVCSTAPGAGR
jgi:hypothetical protein